MKYIYSLLLVFMLLCVACEFKLVPEGEHGQGNTFSVYRYDRLESRYLTTGDFSALQQMNMDYPIETRMLIEKVLQLGPVNSHESSALFLKFFQDSTLQVMLNDIQSEYTSMDDVNEEFDKAFDQLANWLPDFKKPFVYTQIGALDQSIIVGENTIGISLDKYLGENYPLYVRFYPPEQRASMTRKYIVADALNFYLLSLYPMATGKHSQYEMDLHMGKVMWVVNKLLDRKVFITPFVNRVEAYMRKHGTVTPVELLESNDCSGF